MIFSEFESIINLLEKAKTIFSRRPQNQILTNNESRNASAKLGDSRANSHIVRRIEVALGMITDEKGREFPITWFGEYLGMEKPGDLERIILEETEPTFQFLNHLAENLGINPTWLKTGRGMPFKIEPRRFTHWENYFEEIRGLKPIGIYFLRRTTEEGEAIIVLKLSTIKYLILPNIYHISDHVGRAGRRQIDGFCRLIEKLRVMNPHPDMIGLEVEKEELFELYEGEIHPSWLESHWCKKKSHWLDDITDVMHELPISKNYEQWYGEAFVRAQRIVRFERTGSLDVIKK